MQYKKINGMAPFIKQVLCGAQSPRMASGRPRAANERVNHGLPLLAD
jgi:hypothetical protein